MKRRSFTFAIISMIVTGGMVLTGCNWLFTVKDAGPQTTREYEFADFNAVQVGSAFRVDISPSDDCSVRITANESVFRDIRVVQTGNTLKIGLEWPGLLFGNRTLEARITMPELVSLELSGAAKGTVRGFESAGDLNARISGASTLDLDVEAENFVSEISGASEMTARVRSASADVELSGASSLRLDLVTGSFVYESSGASDASGSVEAGTTNIRLTGASEIQLTGSGGDLDLFGSGASKAKLAFYETKNADVDLSGASYAEADVDGRLNVSLSGASELRYGGNPTLGDKIDITGGSKLEPR